MDELLDQQEARFKKAYDSFTVREPGTLEVFNGDTHINQLEYK